MVQIILNILIRIEIKSICIKLTAEICSWVDECIIYIMHKKLNILLFKPMGINKFGLFGKIIKENGKDDFVLLNDGEINDISCDGFDEECLIKNVTEGINSSIKKATYIIKHLHFHQPQFNKIQMGIFDDIYSSNHTICTVTLARKPDDVVLMAIIAKNYTHQPNYIGNNHIIQQTKLKKEFIIIIGSLVDIKTMCKRAKRYFEKKSSTKMYQIYLLSRNNIFGENRSKKKNIIFGSPTLALSWMKSCFELQNHYIKSIYIFDGTLIDINFSTNENYNTIDAFKIGKFVSRIQKKSSNKIDVNIFLEKICNEFIWWYEWFRQIGEEEPQCHTHL